jgi:hypothetical protein
MRRQVQTRSAGIIPQFECPPLTKRFRMWYNMVTEVEPCERICGCIRAV